MALKKILFLFILPCLFFPLKGEKIRAYLTTGGWYPNSISALQPMLDGFIKKAKKLKISGKVKALVVPHAGFVYSGQCAAEGFKQLGNRSDITRIFILGSSHRSGFYGACVSDFTHNSTPLGKIPVDTRITSNLAKEKHFQVNSRIMQREHSIENQLPFIQMVFKKRHFKIVPILFGQLDEENFHLLASTIRKYMDKHSIVIASSDLNHFGKRFGYAPFDKNIKSNLTKLDMGMINKILELDLEGYFKYKKKTGITMCGFVPVGVMMNILTKKTMKGILADYCKSGDLNHDYSLSVSYASIIFSQSGPLKNPSNSQVEDKNPMFLKPKEQKTLMAIARETLNCFYNQNKYPDYIEDKFKLTPSLKKKSGVFVTLKIAGHLRGCIGSIIGKEPLYQGVIQNSINSAVRDPRFPRVQKEELEKISIEISVMTPLQKIKDYKKIRLGIDGVIIKKGYAQAVYLPQVATETGWTLDEFLGHLCQKAGLSKDEYKNESMEFYIFQAQVFTEKQLKK